PLYVASSSARWSTQYYNISLHDALPISEIVVAAGGIGEVLELAEADHRLHLQHRLGDVGRRLLARREGIEAIGQLVVVLEELLRSEEHTSELQSRENLVCRLLLEKKKLL